MRFFILLSFILFGCLLSKANEIYITEDSIGCDSMMSADHSPGFIIILSDTSVDTSKTHPSKQGFRENKKVIASVLAFPFPFGLLGLHRVYLGSKPYMPFVYLGTLGGCFGILPLIDFIAILASDDETLKKFENNPKVFIWSH